MDIGRLKKEAKQKLLNVLIRFHYQRIENNQRKRKVIRPNPRAQRQNNFERKIELKEKD